MKKLTFLIGNGFNFFVSNYLNNLYYNEIINEKLKATRVPQFVIWKKECKNRLIDYCHLLDDITLTEKEYNKKGEYLLSDLSNLCKKINNDTVMESIEKSISKKIKKEMQPLKNSKSSIPKTVRTLFNRYTNGKVDKSFAICFTNLLRTLNYSTISIYTTNYDRIIDELFEDKREKNKFNIEINALHGDYESNVICCSPENKINKINISLFNRFKNDLQNSEVIVIFGMGLESDPHILSELNKLEKQNIIIIEPSPNEYIRKKNFRTSDSCKGFDFLFNNEIYFISTRDFLFINGRLRKPTESPEELYDELKSLLKNLNEI